MRADVFAVYPHIAGVVHRAEIQKHVFGAPRRGQLEVALIPKGIGSRELFAHTRQRRLYRKRHEDFAVELCAFGVYRRDCITPKAVEVLPFRTLHLRTRILRQYVVYVDIPPPLRHKLAADRRPRRIQRRYRRYKRKRRQYRPYIPDFCSSHIICDVICNNNTTLKRLRS